MIHVPVQRVDTVYLQCMYRLSYGDEPLSLGGICQTLEYPSTPGCCVYVPPLVLYDKSVAVWDPQGGT